MKATKRGVRFFIVCALTLALSGTRVARAQVPELPPEAAGALEQAQDASFPVIVQVATASQPVMTVGGFAVRPVCGSPALSVAVVLAVGQVPLQPGFVSTPVNLICAGAFGIGPADPVFASVDQAAGEQLQASLDPVLDQVGAGLEPARPNLAQACSAFGVAMPPTYFLPMPLGRFDVTEEVCGS